MLSSTVVKDAPAPPEVLIPEARDRQRRRYRRSAVLVSIVALVIGLLLALVIAATSGGSGTARPTPKPIAALAASGSGVLVRPVLCFAPPYEAAASTSTSTASPACGASYLLTAAALDVTPTHNGYSWNRGGPDPALAGYPSTSDEPNRTVLLGARGAISSVARMVLGPSELRLSATDVGSVVTHKSHAGLLERDHPPQCCRRGRLGSCGPGKLPSVPGHRRRGQSRLHVSCPALPNLVFLARWQGCHLRQPRTSHRDRCEGLRQHLPSKRVINRSTTCNHVFADATSDVIGRIDDRQ